MTKLLVFYSLGFIFLMLAIVSISYDNRAAVTVVSGVLSYISGNVGILRSRRGAHIPQLQTKYTNKGELFVRLVLVFFKVSIFNCNCFKTKGFCISTRIPFPGCEEKRHHVRI